MRENNFFKAGDLVQHKISDYSFLTVKVLEDNDLNGTIFSGVVINENKDSIYNKGHKSDSWQSHLFTPVLTAKEPDFQDLLDVLDKLENKLKENG